MRLPPIDDDDDLRHILEQHASIRQTLERLQQAIAASRVITTAGRRDDHRRAVGDGRTRRPDDR